MGLHLGRAVFLMGPVRFELTILCLKGSRCIRLATAPTGQTGGDAGIRTPIRSLRGNYTDRCVTSPHTVSSRRFKVASPFSPTLEPPDPEAGILPAEPPED